MLVRVCLDYPESPFVFDVLTDVRGTATGEAPMGGWWGRPRSNDVWPLLHWPDGRIDFGASPEDAPEDRYFRSNLYNIHMAPGAVVTVTDNEGEATEATIRSVTTLAT